MTWLSQIARNDHQDRTGKSRKDKVSHDFPPSHHLALSFLYMYDDDRARTFNSSHTYSTSLERSAETNPPHPYQYWPPDPAPPACPARYPHHPHGWYQSPLSAPAPYQPPAHVPYYQSPALPAPAPYQSPAHVPHYQSPAPPVPAPYQSSAPAPYQSPAHVPHYLSAAPPPPAPLPTFQYGPDPFEASIPNALPIPQPLDQRAIQMSYAGTLPLTMQVNRFAKTDKRRTGWEAMVNLTFHDRFDFPVMAMLTTYLSGSYSRAYVYQCFLHHRENFKPFTNAIIEEYRLMGGSGIQYIPIFGPVTVPHRNLYDFQDRESLGRLAALRDAFMRSDISQLSKRGGEKKSRCPLDQLMTLLWERPSVNNNRVVIEDMLEITYLLPATQKKYFELPQHTKKDWRPSSEGRVDYLIVVKFRETILGDLRATTWTLFDKKSKELWIAPMCRQAKQNNLDNEQARVQLETSMSTMATVLFHLGIKEPVFGCVQTKSRVAVYCCMASRNSQNQISFDVWNFRRFHPSSDNVGDFTDLVLFLLRHREWWFSQVYPKIMAAINHAETMILDNLNNLRWASADFDPNYAELSHKPWRERRPSVPPSIRSTRSSRRIHTDTTLSSSHSRDSPQSEDVDMEVYSGVSDHHSSGSGSGRGQAVGQNRVHQAAMTQPSFMKFRLPWVWRIKGRRVIKV
ncbi:hypothetical protein VKT23_013011 [Stygiomarasmius scandens]|uniref:Uncharacterized protein n=1 Tax=Marasmiellus scandens TaxID=2682957 RepID=A0ABR1J4A0_9AGAR